MPPKTWQAKNYFENWTDRRHIIASKWLTNDRLRCWHLILLVAHLPIDVWHKALVGHCPHFRFSSFMREYLDKVIKADQCAQHVDDIGIAANDTDHLIANLTATFKCIHEAGLKLTMHECHFGATEIDFLGRTITPQGVKPQRHNVQNFLEQTKFPKSKNSQNALLHSISC